MDVSLVHAVFIIFGSLPPIFAEDNIRHRGFVTSLSGAKEVCEDRNETLVSAENDEKRKRIIKVLAENELDATWLFTNFKTLGNWTFTDGSQTILSESQIDVTQGGLCGALSSGDGSFKSLPCNRKITALRNVEGCNPSCHKLYNGTNKYRWHSLNKGILATPYKNNITSFAAILPILQHAGIQEETWISLKKFQFSWPDGTEISLQQWEDRSEDKDDCLILTQNGKMVVVDCDSSNHSVLCFDKGSGEQASSLEVAISVLGVVCGLLLVTALFIAYSWFQPKCPAGRKQEDNQDNQESRQEENQDNQDDNQDNQAEQRPTYEEITDVRLGLNFKAA